MRRSFKGTNLAAYEKLCEIGINIIASGGISTMEELEKLEKIGAWGAILGKALYSGALDLKRLYINSEANRWSAKNNSLP